MLPQEIIGQLIVDPVAPFKVIGLDLVTGTKHVIHLARNGDTFLDRLNGKDRIMGAGFDQPLNLKRNRIQTVISLRLRI